MKQSKLRVIEPNQIAEAKGQKMSKAYLDTLHIALTLVAHAENESPDNLDYEFNVNDYKDKFGLQFNANAYKKLRQGIKNTMKNDSLLTIVDANGNEIDFFPFQEVEYIASELKVHIVFTRRFKRILNELLESRGKKIYFALPDTLQMKSEYSKKLYPILLEFIGKPIEFTGSGSLQGKFFDRIYSLDDFRDVLCIPKSYVIKNIKDVCNVIQAEIEAYTPYHADAFYNQITGRGRYGGKITHICWKIKSKEKIKENLIIENAKSAVLTIEPGVKWIMNLTGLDSYSAVIVWNAAKKHGRDESYIEEAYEVAKNNGARDLGKLMTSFMQHGFSKDRKSLPKKNSFNDFEQRDCDYSDLEMY